jgi:LPS sulfotransferase NodH
MRWIQRHAIQQLARVVPSTWAMPLTRPCFIVGCPRSGSSLFDQLLASHPQIAAYPSEALELWHPRAYPWHVACRDRPFPPIWGDASAFTAFSLARRTPRQEQLIQTSFALCRTISRRPRFVQKCTLIGLMLAYVVQLFPDATFIHLLRDGRATALSWSKRQGAHLRDHPQIYERAGWKVSDAELLRLCAAAWRDIINAIDESASALQLDTSRFLELKYESLCSSPTTVLEAAARLLDVDPHRFDKSLCAVIQSQNFKFSSALSPAAQQQLDEIMGDTLRRKGYGLQAESTARGLA